MLLLHFTVY